MTPQRIREIAPILSQLRYTGVAQELERHASEVEANNARIAELEAQLAQCDKERESLAALNARLMEALRPFSAEWRNFKWVEVECEERHDSISIAGCQSGLKIRREFKAAAEAYYEALSEERPAQQEGRS